MPIPNSPHPSRDLPMPSRDFVGAFGSRLYRVIYKPKQRFGGQRHTYIFFCMADNAKDAVSRACAEQAESFAPDDEYSKPTAAPVMTDQLVTI